MIRVLRLPVILLVVGAILCVSGVLERLFYHPDAGTTPLPGIVAGEEAMTFTSADGTTLHGWFLPAVREGAGRPGLAPTVLHVHGNAGNITSHIGFTDYLPSSGFNLMVFDYRGYGQSHGRATRRDDLIADTAAALAALRGRPDVDPDRIALYAQSLGGAIGLNVMADHPEIRAAVVESPFASWRDIAADALGGGPIARGIARLAIPDWRRPDAAIAAIDRPVLIVHGDADRIVPVEHGRRLAAAGPTAELIELPDGGHNTLRHTHPEIERIVVRFLREHLGPTSP
jgi:dipeptidyl aminopeptidase/acylaminoacyl peptidase